MHTFLQKKYKLQGLSKSFAFISFLALLVGGALILGPVSGKSFAEEGKNEEKKQEEKQPEPKPEPQADPQIVVQGKLYSSLKRVVPVLYDGVVKELLVHAGQKVSKGDPLMLYELDPRVVSNLRQQISPQPLRVLEARIADIAAKLAPLRAKMEETKQLLQQQMASDSSVKQLQLQIEATQIARQNLVKQLEISKQGLTDSITSLEDTLGKGVSYDNFPNVITTTAPIDGHVLWVNPEIRKDATLTKDTAFIIGVMDPMIIRTNIFEIEASRIDVGDKATVTLSSLPNKTFDAEVSRISWTPITPGLDQPSYYQVELTAPNPNKELKEGFKTQIKITPSR